MQVYQLALTWLVIYQTFIRMSSEVKNQYYRVDFILGHAVYDFLSPLLKTEKLFMALENFLIPCKWETGLCKAHFEGCLTDSSSSGFTLRPLGLN